MKRQDKKETIERIQNMQSYQREALQKKIMEDTDRTERLRYTYTPMTY